MQYGFSLSKYYFDLGNLIFFIVTYIKCILIYLSIINNRCLSKKKKNNNNNNR